MRSIRYMGKGELKVLEVPEPGLVRPDDVKIKIAYCGVCGSDLHLKRQEFEFMIGPEGNPMGHEATGTIVELGPAATAKGLKIGDRVTYYFNTHCGSCYNCRTGKEQFCSNMHMVMGAMSDYIVAPEQCVYKLKDTMSLKRAALVEPISVTLHGMDMVHMKAGQTVCIVGGGAMGLILAMEAKRQGATSLTLIEPIAAKRETAKKVGVQYTIDPVNQDRVEEAMKITEGHGFDVVIEASGSVKACEEIEKLVTKGGVLEFFAAMYRPDYNYPLNLFNAFMKEITIIGGVMQSPYMFPRSIQLAEVLELDVILDGSSVYMVEDCEQAFVDQMEGRSIKSLICFDPDAT